MHLINENGLKKGILALWKCLCEHGEGAVENPKRNIYIIGKHQYT